MIVEATNPSRTINVRDRSSEVLIDDHVGYSLLLLLLRIVEAARLPTY